MHFLMSPTTNPAAVADTDFFHPLPSCAKKSVSATAAGLVVGDIRKMHLEIPQLKSMGNIPFGRFSVTKPQTPNPVILHQFVAA